MNDRRFLTFLVFVVISTAAWFVVKLSEDYTTQVQFRLCIEEVPADKWLSPTEQTAKLSMTTTGFKILRYKMLREQRRVVTLPLSEVSYRLERGTTYSFGSLYVTERVAELLDINPTELTMNDDKVYFNLDPLKSKVVPVKLVSDIRPQRQHEVYGIPVLEPASIKIYGPQELIDTLKSVNTQLLSKSNVSTGFTEMVALDLLDDQIHSEVKSVQATVQVEKFTEADVKVPLSQPESLHVRFFPEEVTVKCRVAIKDYPNLTPDLFLVMADRKQIKAREPLLDVALKNWPPFVQILNVTPEKVEYLIVQ
jgi:hypothetical protein